MVTRDAVKEKACWFVTDFDEAQPITLTLALTLALTLVPLGARLYSRTRLRVSKAMAL